MYMIQRKTDQSLLTWNALQTSVPLSTKRIPAFVLACQGLSLRVTVTDARKGVYSVLCASRTTGMSFSLIKVLDSDFARSQSLGESEKKALRSAKFDGLKNSRQNVPPAMSPSLIRWLTQRPESCLSSPVQRTTPAPTMFDPLWLNNLLEAGPLNFACRGLQGYLLSPRIPDTRIASLGLSVMRRHQQGGTA